MKKLSCGIAAIALLGLAGTASAAYIDYSWNDTLTWEGLQLSQGSGGYGYWHNISASGDADAYNPGTDWIDSASVRIWLKDDLDTWGESAEIDISPYLFGVSSWGLGGGGSFNFDYTSNTFQVSFFGLLDLRNDGTLGVYITPREGDFYLTKSVLYADGKRDPDEQVGTVAVPEPGSLALLAIGLIGMGVALSRRRNQK